jgi:hypothetical protein
MHPKPQLCERARLWASLRADEELSELESALLRAHLEGCASCRAFAQGVQATAVALRGTSLERVAPLVVIPRERRGVSLNGVQAVAVAVVVVATGAYAALSGPSQTTSAAKPVSMVAGLDSPDRLRELRRPALVRRAQNVPRDRQVPGEPV